MGRGQVIGQRRLFQQKNLLGGLAPGNDILQSDNGAWLNAQNMVLTKPSSYLSGVVTNKNCATTPPPTKKIGSTTYSDSGFVTAGPIYTRTIATFENADWPSESWAFSGTGTASLVASISEGDQALSCACTAGQTATGTGTVTTNNLAAPAYTILAVDSNWNNVSNFSSGYIRVGSDSTNYRQYNISAPASTGDKILKFDFGSPSSTTGTPDMSAIDYVQISVTAGGGGAITVIFDNLRLASFTSVATSTIVDNAVNVYSSFILDKVVNTSIDILITTGINVGDSILISRSHSGINGTSTVSFTSLKAGFTNVTPETIDGTNFYFTQFPKTGSQSKNILYYVNGQNGYFSYDPDASIGSRNARISSSAYRYICSHKSMIFLAGADPNTVQPSSINDPTTLTAANAVVLPNISGSYITGIYSMDDYLLITRNTDKFVLYGSNPDSSTGDFVLKRVQASQGVVEQKSGCRVGSSFYGFNENGIYVFNGSDDTLVSEGMEQYLDVSGIKLCHLYYNYLRGVVCFSFSPPEIPNPITTFANHYQLIFNPRLRAWSVKGAFNDASSVVFSSSPWGGAQFATQAFIEVGMKIYQLDPTTPTDITTMPWYLQTQWNDAGIPGVNKDFDSLYIYIRDLAGLTTPSVTVTTYTDFDASTAKDTFTSQTPINNVIGPLYLAQSNGKALSIKVAGTCDDQKDEAVMISGYAVTYTERGVP